MKSQTPASSRDPNEGQVTEDECDHAESLESENSAEHIYKQASPPVQDLEGLEGGQGWGLCAINYLWLSAGRGSLDEQLLSIWRSLQLTSESSG